jgi:hypothetical protein
MSSPFSPCRSRRLLLALLVLAAGLWASSRSWTKAPGSSLAAAAAEPAAGAASEPAAPSYDKQILLVYTVNNLGYTDTCG